ncbi:MAG: hypothetical protein RL685_7215, partial [Pseudomonadota bacterium]
TSFESGGLREEQPGAAGYRHIVKVRLDGHPMTDPAVRR